MNIGERAYRELFPDRELESVEIKYSRRFKPYNANIRYGNGKIEFRFSHAWEDVSEEIQVGLAQHLLAKAFSSDKKTVNISLYQRFLEKLPDYIEAEEGAPKELKKSFQRVNEEYFDGFMEQPTLEWGKDSFRQLGRYSYHTNTVRISTLFKNLDEERKWMLDFIMYHELLHKKFGLTHSEKGNCRHHTKEFRELESEFRVEEPDEKISMYISRCKRRGKLRNIFK